MKKHLTAAWVFTLLLAAGCGTTDSDESPTSTQANPTPTVDMDAITYHKNVVPILERNCVGCHVEDSIAPFTLDTYEQVKPLGAAIVDSVLSRRMPPWGLDGSGACNDYNNGRWLSDEDIQTLSKWVEQDMPEGNVADQPAIERAPIPVLERVDRTWDIGVDYLPDNSLTDDYRCFLVDPGIETDLFLTGFEVKPGNTQIVHHVVVYDLYDNTNAAIAAELDAADPGPGYSCYGTAGTPISTVLAAWAPGTPAQFMPEGTGLKVTANRKIAIQVHYNLVPDGATDRSSISVQLEEQVKTPALMGFVGDFDMVLPSSQDATYTFWEGSLSELGLPVSASIYGVFPHMHTLGTRLQLDVVKDDGASCFTRVDDWDFNWQQLSFFDTPIYFNPEDRIRLTCHYDTRSRDAIVPWGDGTQDEMCLALVYLTLSEADGAIDPSTIGEAVDLPGGDADSFSTNLSAQWSQSYDGRGGNSRPTQMDVASDGSLYISLDTEASSMRFGTQLETLPGDGDGVLLKLDSQGELLWHKVFGSPLDDGLGAVETDNEGNIIVVGWYEADMEIDGTTLENATGSRNLFAAKMDSEGSLLWIHSFQGTDYSYVREVAVADNGDVALVGYFYNTISVGEQLLTAEENGSAGLLVHISADGETLWGSTCTSSSRCRFRDVGFLPGGELVVTGRFRETATFGTQIKQSLGSDDGFIARYDVQSDEPTWIKTFGDVAWDYADGLATDSDGNIFVTGLFCGAMRLGEHSSYFNGGYDPFLAKLNSDGETQWLKSFGNVAGDSGQDILPDGSGGAYLSVNHEGPIDLGGGALNRTGSSDLSVAHYDSDGEHLWSKHLGGTSGDYLGYLALHNDIFYVAWSSYGSVEVDGLSTSGSSDGSTIIYAFSE